MERLQNAFQEENQSLRDENHIIRNNLPKLTNIIQGHNPSVILTGNMSQELQTLFSIIEKQREHIGQLESHLENSQNNYERILEQSLRVARKVAKEPVQKASYLQECVEKEEAKVRELEDLLKDRTSQTAKQLSHLKYTEIEQTAEMSIRSVSTPNVKSPALSKNGNKPDENRRSKYMRPLG